MKKNLVLSMMLLFICLPVFAESKDHAGLVLPSDDEVADFSLAEAYAPGIVPNSIMFQRPNIGSMIMGGVLGNILGSLAGLCLGGRMSSSDDDELGSLLLGYAAGSALGSAAGASLAGYSKDWQGSFGRACIGSVLGVGLSWLVVSLPTFQGDAGVLALVPVLILPPIGAAIFYNSSMRPRLHAEPGALLNFSDGRVGWGMPDIQVRPLYVPGLKAKPELRFNVRVLSVEL